MTLQCVSSSVHWLDGLMTLCSSLHLWEGLIILFVPSHVCWRVYEHCFHTSIEGWPSTLCVSPCTCGMAWEHCVFLAVFMGGQMTLDTVCFFPCLWEDRWPFTLCVPSFTCGMARPLTIFLAMFVRGLDDPQHSVFVPNLMGHDDTLYSSLHLSDGHMKLCVQSHVFVRLDDPSHSELYPTLEGWSDDTVCS